MRVWGMNCLVCRGACCEVSIDPTIDPGMLTRFIERRWIRLRTVTGRCSKLSSEGRCTIHLTRPLICRVYQAGSAACLDVVHTRRCAEEYRLIRDTRDPPVEVLYR